MDKQVFNFKEAQTALGVGKGTIYTLMDEGQLPFFCVGRRRYVTRQALEDFSQFHYENGFVGPLEVDEDFQSAALLALEVADD